MFDFIKDKLKKVYSHVTQKAHALFSRSTVDEQTLKELEFLLIAADTGVHATRTILNNLKKAWQEGTLKKGDDLRIALEQQLLQLLATTTATPINCKVFLLVGINGSGKTTFIAKLAHKFLLEKKRILLVAGDTFRAAATEQLQQWAQRLGVDIVIGQPNQDPAALIFAGCEKYKKEDYDILIIDTAGRLQTKVNLMKELEKIKRVIIKQLPEQPTCTLLTVDAMLGQNSLEQAKLFHESTQLDGIVLTKMDGTGKGGIVFAIAQELKIPVAYISFGEQPEALKTFDAQEYVQQLLQ